MSEAKFTPGPWAWGDYLEEVNPVSADPLVELVAYGKPKADGSELITTVLDSSDCNPLRVKNRADAYLIAAAPDLYEALKALPLDAFDKDPADIDAAEFVYHASEFIEAMSKARAALAKSEGR